MTDYLNRHFKNHTFNSGYDYVYKSCTFDNCTWSGQVRAVSFTDCTIVHSFMEDAKIEYVRFLNCDINMQVQDSVFSTFLAHSSRFNHIILRNIDSETVNLSGRLYSVNIYNSTIQGRLRLHREDDTYNIVIKDSECLCTHLQGHYYNTFELTRDMVLTITKGNSEN